MLHIRDSEKSNYTEAALLTCSDEAMHVHILMHILFNAQVVFAKLDVFGCWRAWKQQVNGSKQKSFPVV